LVIVCNLISKLFIETKYTFIFIVFFSIKCANAQIYTGTVKASANAPLHGANLIAIPDGDDLITAFSISDEKDKACPGCFSPILAQGVKFNSCDLLVVPYKNHRFMLINGLLRN